MVHSNFGLMALSALFAVSTAQATVTPYEYMKVSGGVDGKQRVVTDYYPHGNDVIRARYSLANTSHNATIFCARNSTTYDVKKNRGLAFFAVVSQKPRFDYDTTPTPGSNKSAETGKVYDLVISNGVATITSDGLPVESFPGSASAANFTASGPMVLFSSNAKLDTNGNPSEFSNGFDGTFYYLEVLAPGAGGTLQQTHYFVPGKDDDGKVVLFDLATKQTYSVAATSANSFRIEDGTPEISFGPKIAETTLVKDDATDVYTATVTLADEPGTVSVEAKAEGHETKSYPGSSQTAAGGTASFTLTNPDLERGVVYTVEAVVDGARGTRRQTIGRAYISGFSQDGVWIGTTNGDWSDPANWEDGLIAGGIGATATFTNAVDADLTVTITNNVTVGRLVIGAGGSASRVWTLKGSETAGLVFDADGLGGQATLDVDARATLAITYFRGSAPVRKNGAGALRLSAKNTSALYTGRLQVAEGDLHVQGTECLAAMTTLLGGGDVPVHVRPTNLVTVNHGTITVDGGSTNLVSFEWAINNSIKFTGGFNLERQFVMNNNYTVHLTGKVTASGSGGFRLIGGGTLLVQRHEGNIGKVQVSKGTLSCAQFTAPINFSQMTFGDETTGAGSVGIRIGDGDGGKNLALNGTASLHFTSNGTGTAFLGTRDVNNSALQIDAPIQVDRLVKLTNTGATYDIGNGKYGLRLNGVVSGDGGLILAGKDETHYVCLNGANTYTGGTIVSNGYAHALGSGLFGTGDVKIFGKSKLRLSKGLQKFADTATLWLIDEAGGKPVVDIISAEDGLEIVDRLFIGNKQMKSGTWGATGSGATHIDDVHFTGAGRLTVKSGPPPGLLLLVR